LEIFTENRGHVVIIHLGAKRDSAGVSGEVELDVDNNYMLSEAVENELARGHNAILLNIKLVNYVDSSGLGAIFDSYKQVSEKGGTFRIANPNLEVKRVLEITKISKKIDIFPSEELALQGF
jgi:stage II sporulation protein AA (anti-sigma F factor antagonist)